MKKLMKKDRVKMIEFDVREKGKKVIHGKVRWIKKDTGL
jgi:hypothetical protein